MNLKLKLKQFLVWFRGFIKRNPGALPILGFQGLLITCAVLLVFGMNETADNIAVIAYFMLVAGVLIQLADYVRESRHSRKVGE
ncbi:MAG: hypothetical protein QXU45_03095 [Candidatus Bathyarchaeia archaeon]